jgi:hypothetical protein
MNNDAKGLFKAGAKFNPANPHDPVMHQIFAHGATTAFTVGAIMALAGSAIIWLFLNVKHQELATEDALEGGVHVG